MVLGGYYTYPFFFFINDLLLNFLVKKLTFSPKFAILRKIDEMLETVKSRLLFVSHSMKQFLESPSSVEVLLKKAIPKVGLAIDILYSNVNVKFHYTLKYIFSMPETIRFFFPYPQNILSKLGLFFWL